MLMGGGGMGLIETCVLSNHSERAADWDLSVKIFGAMLSKAVSQSCGHCTEA